MPITVGIDVKRSRVSRCHHRRISFTPYCLLTHGQEVGWPDRRRPGRAEDQSGVLVCCGIQPFAKWLHPGRADGQGFLEIFRESRYAVLCRTGVGP